MPELSSTESGTRPNANAAVLKVVRVVEDRVSGEEAKDERLLGLCVSANGR